MLDTVKNPTVNGLDLAALGEVVEAIEKDAGQAKVGFQVTTRWAGQTRSETTVEGFTMGGERIARSHKIVADEPCQLLGSDRAPNPQELLMAAFNACIMVGYVAGAAPRASRSSQSRSRPRASSTCAASSASATRFRRAMRRSITKCASRAMAPRKNSRKSTAM